MSCIDEEGYFLAIRALGRHHRVEIDQARFDEIAIAWANLRHVVNLEEGWDAIVQNYVELEKGLLDAAAANMILSNLDYHNFQDTRLAFAVKLTNLLSTCRAYLDHTPRHLNRLVPAGHDTDAFKLATNREYDARFGYRFMEALRNFAQHSGLPLHGTTYDARWKEDTADGSGMLEFSVATNVVIDKLRGDKAFKQAVLADVTEKELATEPLIRGYIEGLSMVHVELRERLKARIEDWMKTVRDAMAEFIETSGDPATSIIGLCAMQLAPRNEWKQTVPLVKDMLERLEMLQKRNRSLVNLTRRFVSSAPRLPKKK